MSATLSSPEIIRYCRLEAKPGRLISGFITINIVAFAVYLIATQGQDPGKQLAEQILWMQGLGLLVYGTTRTASSVSEERVGKTWDFQRLTPLTGWELAWGKLIGSPVFAYFLTGALIPWAIFGTLVARGFSWATLWEWYGIIAATAFGILAFGLFCSSYNESVKGRQGVLGFMFMAWIGTHVLIVPFSQKDTHIYFYEIEFLGRHFYPLSAAVFGFWALAGATWRIGQDLQEGEAFWRLPAFLVFTHWYQMGIEVPNVANQPISLVWTPTLLLYVASWWSRYGPDDVRRWRLSPTARQSLDRAPIWVVGLITLVLLSLASATNSGFQDPKELRLAVLLPAFAARDLMFLQWCRLSRSRRPDTMAMVYLVVAYLVPITVLAAFKAPEYVCWFMPIPDLRSGATLNLLPGLLQAAAMGVAVSLRIRELEAGPGSKSA